MKVKSVNVCYWNYVILKLWRQKAGVVFKLEKVLKIAVLVRNDLYELMF